MANAVFVDHDLQDDNFYTLERLTFLVLRLTQDFVFRFKSGRLTEHEREIVAERVRTGRLVEATIANLSAEVVGQLDDDQIISIYLHQWDELSTFAKEYYLSASRFPRLYPGDEDVFYVRRLIATDALGSVPWLLASPSRVEIRLADIRWLVDAYVNAAADKVASPLYSVFSAVQG